MYHSGTEKKSAVDSAKALDQLKNQKDMVVGEDRWPLSTRQSELMVEVYGYSLKFMKWILNVYLAKV